MESDVNEWFCSFNSSEVQAQVMPVSGTTLQTQTAWKYCIQPTAEKEMATLSSILAWRIPGQRSLVGCRLWGRRDRHDWSDLACMHACSGEGNGNPLQYSCLENPRDRGAWWAAIYGVAQSQTRLTRLSSSSSSQLQMPGTQRHYTKLGH